MKNLETIKFHNGGGNLCVGEHIHVDEHGIIQPSADTATHKVLGIFLENQSNNPLLFAGIYVAKAMLWDVVECNVVMVNIKFC